MTEKHVLSNQNWLLVRSKLIADWTNDLLTDKHYLQACMMTSPDCQLECSTTELRETQVVSKVILVGGVIGHASHKAHLQQCARHSYNDLHHIIQQRELS